MAIAQHAKGLTHSYPLPTAVGLQGARFIGEADLYRLVMSSKIAGAVTFKDWIVEEVLPAPAQNRHLHRSAGSPASSTDTLRARWWDT
ncbi:MAG: hypothetical protein K9N47_11715 [Prosthecobacter sp.]|nr:hypothetical protein [Prosthecobacter sp.]